MAEIPHLCPKCRKTYRLKDPKPGAAFKCKPCGVLLEIQLELDGEPGPPVREIPVRLGRYHIDAEVGRGGMGVIYKGRQEGLNRPVAIKMMLPGPASDGEMAHRFEREARSAAALRHPNIVAVHEIGTCNGQPFFSMDFVDGKTLDQAFDGPIPPKRGAEIVRDVARAIHYAHKKGIIHRDLKPANILMEKDGTPRVTDFGLAKDLASQSMISMTGEVMGTPAYMSPEQAEGRIREVDAQSDVYSMGAILYWILTGRSPFESASVADAIHKVVYEYTTEPVKVNPLAPGELSAICMKAIEKQKTDRYRTAGELADDLDRFLRGETIRAKPPSAADHAMRRFRRHRVATLVVAGISIAAIAGIAAVYFGVRRSDLDLLEKNLQDPALRPTAAVSLFQGLPTWSGRDGKRARALALGIMPDFRDSAIAAFETGKLDDWAEGREAFAKFLDAGPDRPRIIRWFASKKDRSVVPRMVRLLGEKEVRLDAIRYFRAVPDASAFYALGVLASDREVGEEARAALQQQYVNKVMSFFGTGSSVGGTIGELGRIVDQHNRQMEDLLDGKKADAVDVTIAALKTGDPASRMKAAYELAAKSEPRAREALLGALADEDDGVARMAADSLARIGADREGLLSRLKDSRPRVRRGAAFVLGRLGDKSARSNIDEAYKVESDASAKETMLDALTLLR